MCFPHTTWYLIVIHWDKHFVPGFWHPTQRVSRPTLRSRSQTFIEAHLPHTFHAKALSSMEAQREARANRSTWHS